jgi:hypothetical protein
VRIAVDVCVSKRLRGLLEAAGHRIVAEAKHAERDTGWFGRALNNRAEVIISADKEVLRWTRRRGLHVLYAGWMAEDADMVLYQLQCLRSPRERSVSTALVALLLGALVGLVVTWRGASEERPDRKAVSRAVYSQRARLL